MRHLRPLLVTALAVLLAHVADAGETTRESILETARRFATVRWRAEEQHVGHGEDAHGVRVDTPDVSLDPNGWRPGEENVGMPYAWGGFTSLESFEEELRTLRFAGHVPSRGNAPSSVETVGVDCSGLVSRCWDLPLKQSTRSLGALCYELDDYTELLPGDVVNRFDSHVAIFTGWANEQRTVMNVIEAARLRVEESTYTLADLRARSFHPMRYKLLDERWVAMPEAREGAPGTFRAAQGGPAPADPVSELFRADAVEPGAWAQYAAEESRLAGRSPVVTWMAVGRGARTLEAQRRLQVDDERLATGASFRLDAPPAELLALFGTFSNPLSEIVEVERRIEPGTYRLGERELPARRLVAVIEARMLSRSTHYPVRLEVDCVLSDHVPLLGVCEASLVHEIHYGEHDGEEVVGRQEHRYRLTAFGWSAE